MNKKKQHIKTIREVFQRRGDLTTDETLLYLSEKFKMGIDVIERIVYGEIYTTWDGPVSPSPKGRIREFRQTDRYRQRQHLNALRKRAKKIGVPFNLEMDDITPPTHCPVLGIPLVRTSDDWSNSPSVDRIIPERGYVKDNITIVSALVNTIKGRATPDQLMKIALYYNKDKKT